MPPPMSRWWWRMIDLWLLLSVAKRYLTITRLGDRSDRCMMTRSPLQALCEDLQQPENELTSHEPLAVPQK